MYNLVTCSFVLWPQLRNEKMYKFVNLNVQNFNYTALILLTHTLLNLMEM